MAQVESTTDGRVLLHIGLPKTGTTSLQEWLWSNRETLRELGCLYPGNRPQDQWLATLDLQGGRFAEYPIAAEGTWASLVEQVQAWPGQSVISHEMLAVTKPDEIERIWSDFGGRKIHVALTLRDLSRVVPATWQERAKNGAIESWTEFVREVSRGPAGGHDFWEMQDAAEILERWSKYVSSDRIHVITVPPPGRGADLLLARFATVLGVDPRHFGARPRRPNQSIGAVEVALVQHLNKLLRGASIDFDTYHRLIKHLLVPDYLATRAGQAHVALPLEAQSWLDKQLERTLKAVDSLDCHVTGDLGDLRPSGLREEDDLVDPDAVTEMEVLETSAEVIVELTRRVHSDSSQIATLRAERDHAVAEAQVRTMERMKRRVVRAENSNGVVRVLLRLWRRMRRTPGSSRV